MGKIWDQAVKDRVCALWSEGFSCSEVANTLSHEGHYMTRNAAIGIVNRNHPEGPRKSSPRRTKGIYTETKTPKHPKPVPPPPPPEPVLAPELQAIVDSGLITLENLHPRMCKFPIGDVLASNFTFCGKAQKPGYSYCPVHCKICFQPLQHNAAINAHGSKVVSERTIYRWQAG